MSLRSDFTSKAILGAAQLGLNYGVNNKSGRPSREHAHDILRSAAEGGVRWLDTARAYGNSEQVIGEFIEQKANSPFQVITKFDLSRGQSWAESLNQSIRKLGEGNVHSIMFHSFDGYRRSFDEIELIQSRIVDLGITRLGVSLYSTEEIEAVLDRGGVKLIQVPFNVLDNSLVKGDLLQRAESMGIEVHTRSVFLQGAFFMSKEQAEGHQSIRSIARDLERLRMWCKKNEISMQQLCLAYVLRKTYISGVLFGVENLGQLEELLDVISEVPAIDKFQEWRVQHLQMLNPTNW